MKKKYYYTIGEVCNYLELQAYVLRYWEKEFPQLKPKKKQGRNRKYTQNDIELLKKIKFMLYTQKFTIQGAINNLKEDKKGTSLPIPIVTEKDDKKEKVIKELNEIKKILIDIL